MFKNILLKILQNQRIPSISYISSKARNEKEFIKLTPISKNDEWIEPEIQKVGDIQHHLRLSKFNRRHEPEFYLRLINKAYYDRDKEKMLSIFFHDMLIRDRVMPSRFMVNILLKHLASFGGSSDLAFKIVQKSIDIGIDPSDVTISLLFKNCAKEISGHELYFNSDNKSYEVLTDEEKARLQIPANRAYKLWQKLISKEMGLGILGLNSLISTLVKALMFKEAMLVLDNFIDKGNKIDHFTLNAILDGCVLQRRNGLGLALIYFNKLYYDKRFNIRPDGYTFTILLKVVRVCQFGDEETLRSLIEVNKSERRQEFISSQQKEELQDQEHQPESDSLMPDHVCQESTEMVVHCLKENFLERLELEAAKYGIDHINHFFLTHFSPHSSSVLAFRSPTNFLQLNTHNIFNHEWILSTLSPADKLCLVGGVTGLLAKMKNANTPASEFVLTSLLSCCPLHNKSVISQQTTTEDIVHIEDFFAYTVDKIAAHFKIQPDRAMRNLVLKRSNLTSHSSVGTVDLSDADPYTWSSLAKSCQTVVQVRAFLAAAHKMEIVLSANILESAIFSCTHWSGLTILVEEMLSRSYNPSRRVLSMLEQRIAKHRSRQQKVDRPRSANSIKYNVDDFFHFQMVYSDWLDKCTVARVATGEPNTDLNILPSEYVPRE